MTHATDLITSSGDTGRVLFAVLDVVPAVLVAVVVDLALLETGRCETTHRR